MSKWSRLKKAKLISSLLSILIILIIIGLLLLKKNWTNIVNKQLKSKLEIPNHIINVEKSYIKLFSTTLIFNNISIKESENKNKTIPLKLDLSIDELEIQLFSIFSLLADNPLNKSKIKINDSNIFVELNTQKKDALKLKKHIKKLKIKRFELTDSNIQLIKKDELNLKVSIDKFHVKNMKLIEIEDKNFPFDFTDFQINLNDFFFKSEKSYYHYSFKNLKLNDSLKRLEIRKLKIIPDISSKEFFSKFTTQKSYTKLSIEKVNIDSYKLNNKEKDLDLFIPEIKLTSLVMSNLKDKNYRLDTSKIIPMPLEYLDKIKFQFRINQINASKMHYSYLEIPKEEEEAFKIYFSNCNVKIDNISNRYNSKEKEKQNLNINFMGYLLNKGKLQLNVKSNYSKPKDIHFKASLVNFDLQTLNSITQKSIGIKFRSGYCEKLQSTGYSENNILKGTVKFEYNKLNIAIENKKYNFRNRTLVSDIANIFIRKENPRKNGHLKIGHFEYYRNVHKNFINFIWKSNLSGIKKSIGLPGERRDRKTK
ncbi:MAG: hypothetical protein ACEPOW_03995 [Bacteroidales bacterium]